MMERHSGAVSAAQARPRIDQLTGLRYFAAVLVFVSHFSWNGANPAIGRLAEQGYVGVSFFFVLSGFILSYSYSDRLRSRSLSYGKYLLLRAARLTPLHFATAAFVIAFPLYSNPISPLKTVFNLSYLQSWIPNSFYYFSLNGPSWSLSDEMFFYVCVFPMIFIPARYVYRAWGALAAIIVATAFVFYRWFDGVHLFGSGSTISHWLFYIFPGFRALEFITGMALYRLWENGWRPEIKWPILAYVGLAVAMYFGQDIPESFRYSLYYLPIITFFFIAHMRSDSLVSRVFSARPLVILGDASFAFYLIHQQLIYILRSALHLSALPLAVGAVITLAIASALSVLVFYLYEKKAEAFLRSLVLNRTVRLATR